MTLYTYHCDNCGTFEEFRDNNDRDRCDCGCRVRKSWGGNFKLVGNGFYKNDSYRDNRLKRQEV